MNNHDMVIIPRWKSVGLLIGMVRRARTPDEILALRAGANAIIKRCVDEGKNRLKRRAAAEAEGGAE